MKILVTGAAGYLGSVLLPLLLSQGHQVVALDNFCFQTDSLDSVKDNPNLTIKVADTRTFNPLVLDGVSAVVDLAAISQPDPLSALDPSLYYDINFLAALRVATLSKEKGVKQYIFPSTCSVYGIQRGIGNEDSRLNPLEIYGQTKLLAEQNLLRLNEGEFSVTIVRFATLYGYSPKMRFDLLLNGMTLYALQNKKIRILGDGEQRRPVVHVKDAANAISVILGSNKAKVAEQVFNIGSNDQNFKVSEVAELIKSDLKNIEFEFYGDPDKRSYWVNFDKVSQTLNYKTNYKPVDGVREISAAIKKGVKPADNHWVIKWWANLSQEGRIWLDDPRRI